MSNEVVEEIVEENEAALREYANKDHSASYLAEALVKYYGESESFVGGSNPSSSAA